jgi:hypothetical protein
MRLRIFELSPEHVAQHRQSLKPGDTTEIRLMGRDVEAIHTPEGLRAVSRGKPIKPTAVRKYPGWGQEGKMDLAQIRNLCGKKS